jgi:hypothetical protein
MISTPYAVLPCFPLRLVWNVRYVMYSEIFCHTCLHVVYILRRVHFGITLGGGITIFSNFERQFISNLSAI